MSAAVRIGECVVMAKRRRGYVRVFWKKREKLDSFQSPRFFRNLLGRTGRYGRYLTGRGMPVQLLLGIETAQMSSSLTGMPPGFFMFETF